MANGELRIISEFIEFTPRFLSVNTRPQALAIFMANIPWFISPFSILCMILI
jgi:hypothetical protein